MKYRLLILLGLLLLGLVWLNGPGLRLITPRVAVHFLEKAGLRGNFTVGGNLTGGLSFSDLHIEGDKELASLSIDKVTPEYEWRGLIRGELKGLTIDGVHADLRLGLEKPEEPEKPPLDLKKLVTTVRSIRGRVIPLNLELRNLTLAATREGKPVIGLAKSGLSHAAGSDDIRLELGAITDASGREWPAQQSAIVWSQDALDIRRIDPLPGVSLRDLVVQLPAGGEPSLDGELHLDEAVFLLYAAPGFSSAKIDLKEGKLQVDETARRFGVELPAAATLTSLSVELDQLLPDPKSATGTVRTLLENVAWQDWLSSELSLDATLTDAQATVNGRSKLLGTEIAVEATAPVARSEKSFTLGETTGKFNVADVPALLRELSARVPAIDPEAVAPASSIDGSFSVAFASNKPQSADVDLSLKPQDVTIATPMNIKARWAPDQPLAADLVLDGAKVNTTYQIQTAGYKASAEFEEFTTARIERWLSIAKVKLGGTASLTGRWDGGGEIKANKHRGELSFTQATWSREMAEPITAIGGMAYDWPSGFETKGLRVRMGEQGVALEAALSHGLLDLRNFTWTRGIEELAHGTASLPIPEDFSKWRDTLARDARPLDVSIDSKVLSLGLLKEWVPALEQLDPRSTGQLGIHVSGTYSDPLIDAKFVARDLRSPARPQLPPADLKISLVGGEGRLRLEGEATSPDFPAAVMKADMAFRPAEWAQNPASIKDEDLVARLDLPRLDLSRFNTLVPSAEQLSGALTGNVGVSGKVGKPEIKGLLELTGGALRLKDQRIPPLEGVAAAVEFALDRAVVKNLRATVAGGSLQGEGTLSLSEGKPGPLDVRLRGNHLPLLRNDYLIVRANGDLRLQGAWENAVVSGSVGLVDSIFYRDIELLPIGTPFTGPSAAAIPKFDKSQTQVGGMPEPFRNWGLNVTVRTDAPLIIRGNLANGDISGSMKIGGNLGNPAPDGDFKVRNFKASLPFSTLSVRSGLISFKPDSGFDPILEIRGTAEPRPYTVNVYAYGNASNPQLLLTSNPPLPDNEIMTLLATGTTTSGLEDPSVASSRAMHLLAEEIRHGRVSYTRRLRPLLGLLDKVNFSVAESDPYSNDKFSTATISLTDKWFLSTGMGETGDSRILAIWRLTFH
ncbi:translocation/assembly module TamB domain-containing protein [Luteolibacter yonseiensis]|uniref:Translocation/assembly module TamB domain-containing protein n=1 Tax=Luteolibacter yonseiensis TaxID=1144680 RepID=A0A934R3L5_9BACT|nr:translocation/assembly module TamB domain-containing protein [Luteolibacter yonseiensis]MBK1817773.1 translocation/assembly module TamB domain-containing protein [Luteolibacter yonseiensis]